MAIYLSEKLKQFRKANDLTQEQIAEIFNVSVQSVSRWETGATYPDIELLPSIAAYYKITVDELLGVDKIKDKKRIEEINKEVSDKWNSGHIDETLELLRNAVREFPQEYSLQNQLALSLAQQKELDKEKAKNNLSEAIAIRERILENSTDDETRYSTLFGLSRAYQKAGDIEKAVETAKKLPCTACSRDIVLTTIYEGNELYKQLKRNILFYTHSLAVDINKLANSMYDSGSPQRIKLINKAIGIFEFICEDGDYGVNNLFLKLCYCQLALNYYNIKDMDNTLNCLEKAAQHAIDFDTITDFKHHTSLAVQGAGNFLSFVKNHHYNECYDLLHVYGLAKGIFKSIEDDERYKAVISKLEKYAKSE